MLQPFLFENSNSTATSADQGTLRQFADLVYAGESDLHDIAQETIRVVESMMHASTDEQLAAFASRGRGAEFTALHLFNDEERNDMLRLHLYPNRTRDGEYHRHGRQIISTVTSGRLINDTANVLFCEPENAELDVWDCTRVDDTCVPTRNNALGARLSPLSIDTIEAGDTYDVPTDIYHKVAVQAGTLTLCWFARSAMDRNGPLIEGRIIKPFDTTPEPIPQLVPGDIRDLRQAFQ